MTNEVTIQTPSEITDQAIFESVNMGDIVELNEMQSNFSLTMKYKTAEQWAQLKDQELRCFFMGFKDIPNEKNEMVECGVFVSETECFLAAGMTLLDVVKKLPVKTPISITYKERKKNSSSKGSTMIFEVKLMKKPEQKSPEMVLETGEILNTETGEVTEG